MKIHLDGVNLDAPTGPNTFARRLAVQLTNAGHTVLLGSGEHADVSLVFIQRSGQKLAKKVVHRLDGVWFKPSEFATRNVPIKAVYDIADAIVWQSDFNRAQISKWWGVPKVEAVIHNGIDMNRVAALTIPELIRLRQQNEMVFVSSSNWHSQKRLKQNIELFEMLRGKFYPESCLIVMGDHPDVFSSDPRVMYTGSLPEQACLEVYAAANWMFHLAWLDHCPNVVIEALSQGTPVVCSEHGGTKELVGSFGIVLKESRTYEYTLENYDVPPKIDVAQITERLPEKSELGPFADIDIRTVAQKYVDLFNIIV